MSKVLILKILNKKEKLYQKMKIIYYNNTQFKHKK